MADLPGRFGPYEIVSPLGAGGMGQVYRGRDTRLQRFVAIKVLQDAAALDPERQRRFAQEALAASALNHPNILTVYDVGVEGDIQFLVSELIDGDSLRTEMNRGRLPLKRLLDVVLQIADGLAAAHEAGIVHRDLKPENVMVTAHGRVKIVDFGLAKTPDVEPALAGGPSATQTAAGLIMGTVPYMSPEQARGGPADFRSDQFALGVMLYEMATATHPFRRETGVQTLSAIIADEPPEVADAAPSLPVPVRWLIRRLLAKAPRERYAHSADLAAEVRTIRDHLSEATTPTPVPTEQRRIWLVPAAATALAAAGLLLGAVLAPQQATAGFDRFTPFATDPGYQGAPTWSPDGKQIAYQAEVDGVVQIFVRTPGSPTRTQITNSRFDCYISAWSPADGNIYYHSAAREADGLWRVSPVPGARPELVIENASQSAILPSGRAIYFIRDPFGEGMFTTFWIKTLPDGKEERYTRGELGTRIGSGGNLRLSQDGSRLLLWMGTAGAGGTRADFWDIALPDGEPRVVMPGISRAGLAPPFFTWLPDNRHVLVTRSDGSTPGNHLWVVDTHDTSAASSAPRSTAYPLTTTPGNESSPSISPDGRTIAFTWDATDFDLFEVPIDGSPLKPFRRSTRNEYDPAVSPGTTQFAFVTDQTGNLQIWRENQEGYLRQPIVTEADFVGPPSMAIGSLAFSPDGTKLAFQRADTAQEDPRALGFRIWIAPLSGGKPVTALAGTTETYHDAPTWSPDSASIAFVTARKGQPIVAKADVGANAPPTILISERVPGFLARPQWSPDGRWILCETLDGLTIVTPNGTDKQIISDTGWLTYAWDRDSRRIFGLRPTDDLHHFMLVSLDMQTREERVINPRLGAIPQALQPIRGFSRLSSGGFLTSIASVKSDIYLLEGFRVPRTWWDRIRSWGRFGSE
jgi:eukaryotic-like serine/threonine-protein kinase